jgi:hypothetical protein
MNISTFPFLFSCTETTEQVVLHPVPEHSECTEDGSDMPDAVCSRLIEEDGRLPTVPENKSGVPLYDDDPRLEDTEYQWLTDQAKQCACACCHSSVLGGPGAYFWDIDFEPVWIDSASRWSLWVLSGRTDEPDQTLPTDDLERLNAIVEFELNRRDSFSD